MMTRRNNDQANQDTQEVGEDTSHQALSPTSPASTKWKFLSNQFQDAKDLKVLPELSQTPLRFLPKGAGSKVKRTAPELNSIE